MGIVIHSLSAAPPDWIHTAITTYTKRLSGRWAIQIHNTRLQKRSKNQNQEALSRKESHELLSRIAPSDFVVTLDELGKGFTSLEFARELNQHLENHQDIHLILGGPEGLGAALKQRAQQSWRLSNLTFPHTLAKVILCEQIYRAWSIVHQHPYHNS